MQSHHAIVLAGSSLETVSLPEAFRVPSIDVAHYVADRLNIDTVRSITEAAHRRPVAAREQVFVIVTNSIPVEAQNALLKLFEDPPASARFYVIIPQPGMLLPTLRSRVLIITDEANEPYSAAFSTFVSASFAERLEMVATWAKDKANDTILAVARDAEQYVQTGHLTNRVALEAVLMVGRYIRTNGASKKMLLEQLALTIPIGKV